MKGVACLVRTGNLAAIRCVATMVVLLLWATPDPVQSQESGSALTVVRAGEARYRQPVALATTADDRWALVANRRSGSISVIDLRDNQWFAEFDCGKTLSDLTLLPGEKLAVATDEASHELLVLRVEFSEASVRLFLQQRLPVPAYPVSVVVSHDGRRAFVASLWSRRLAVVDLPLNDQPAKVIATLDLPFAPRKQLLVRDSSRLLVADSFSGKIAIVDAQNGSLLSVRAVPAHNIRGLAVSPDGSMLLIAHQLLNDFAHSDRNDVHWGLLMSNDLRWVRLDRFLDSAENLFDGGHMHPLGHAGSATGDPSGVAIDREGRVLVALGGVGEVATGKESDFSLERIRVGKRPTAIAFLKAAGHALVANTFGDTISRIDVPKYEVAAEIQLGPTSDLSLQDRGEQVFYDAKLSHDGWMSCHSCHSDGHSNGQMNDNFSDGSFGAAKRVLSTLGLEGTAPFAWNGGTADLAKQIRNSVTRTMQNDEGPSAEQAKALLAFLRSLTPPPAVDVARSELDHDRVQRGKQLFDRLGCANCHAPPLYTTPETYDVGLEDKLGNRTFNPPSLRGVSQREPLLHDGRAANLRELFEKHRHQLKEDVAPEQIDLLIQFLRSL